MISYSDFWVGILRKGRGQCTRQKERACLKALRSGRPPLTEPEEIDPSAGTERNQVPGVPVGSHSLS